MDGFLAVDVFKMFIHDYMKSRIASGHRRLPLLVPLHLEVTDTQYVIRNRCLMEGSP